MYSMCKLNKKNYSIKKEKLKLRWGGNGCQSRTDGHWMSKLSGGKESINKSFH